MKIPYDVLMDYYMRNVGVAEHPMKYLRSLFDKRDFLRGDELKKKRSNSIVRVSGLLVMIHTPPTRSGKRVMFVTLEDETGLIDLVVFETVQKRWAKEMLASELLSFEGVLKRDGRKGSSVSIVAKRLLPQLSGNLEHFLMGPFPKE